MNKLLQKFQDYKGYLMFVACTTIFGTLILLYFFFDTNHIEFWESLQQNYGEAGRILSLLNVKVVNFFVMPPFHILDYFVFTSKFEWKYSVPFFFFYYLILGSIAYFIASKLKVQRTVWLAVGILLFELIVMRLIT